MQVANSSILLDDELQLLLNLTTEVEESTKQNTDTLI